MSFVMIQEKSLRALLVYKLFENADRTRRTRSARKRLDAISKATGMSTK